MMVNNRIGVDLDCWDGATQLMMMGFRVRVEVEKTLTQEGSEIAFLFYFLIRKYENK